MSLLSSVYRTSLTLLADLYELSMANAYWKAGVSDREACFHHYFRSNPFGGGYTISCGLESVIDFLEHFRFQADDLAYLADLRGGDGKALFESDFLEYLGAMTFSCDVDAIPEGRVMFAPEPLIRVSGPIIQCQLIETALLNLLNFQTLIATKSSRVCRATRGDPVIEFGLRRAQGIDGGISATRAAYVGGCVATSNLLAGKLLDIPVRGTHAHSWVMFFADEAEAFHEYAEASPNNVVLLVDTYNTLNGVRRAVETGKALRERGYDLLGVRLDSGDLAYFSIEARKILDAAGFSDTAIVASNELDEHTIENLKQQGAKINIWGVGTRLVTGHEQAALGGTYKLSAVRQPGDDWVYKLKLSEQAIKVGYPGILQVRRYHTGSELLGDAIFDEPTGLDSGCTLVDPLDPTRRKNIAIGTPYEDLLIPIFPRRAPRLRSPCASRSSRAHEHGTGPTASGRATLCQSTSISCRPRSATP